MTEPQLLPQETWNPRAELNPGVAETLPATDALHIHVVMDTEGFMRPVYEIGDRQIMFRGRQEIVRIEDVPVQVLQGPGQEPLPVEYDFNFQPDEEKNKAKLEKYNQYTAESTSTPGAILVSANTPEGILETAALLNPKRAAELGKLAEEMARGTYSPEAMKLLDAVTACLYVNDGGELGTQTPDSKDALDINAYALVTAALSGDERANEVVEARIEKFKHIFAEQQLGSMAINSRQYDEWVEALGKEPEELKAENVALIHSTAFPIALDEKGEVVLKPSSQHRKDKFPRATIHFTANSQVTSHYAGSWDDGNRLIVGNMKKMIDANGNPSVMSEVDTFFSVNPGQELVIPGASVIEGHSETESLITTEGQLVKYKSVANSEYSEGERNEIELLAQKYGITHNREYYSYADTVREITLRQTMEQKGVNPSQMITAGAHYGSNQNFNNSYVRLRKELGVLGGGLHVYTTESNIEKQARDSIMDTAGNVRVGEGYGYSNHLSAVALRHVTASGYWPARYAKPKEDPYRNAPFV